MNVPKPVQWIAIGLFLGAASSGSARAVQPPQEVAAEQKLKSVYAGTVAGMNPNIWPRIVHDPVSKGCWLFLETTDWATLAPAPQSACADRPGLTK